MSPLVDTHCHLNHADFDPALGGDGEAALARAQEAGVSRLIIVGYDAASSARACDLAQTAPGLYAAIGIHPDAAAEWDGSAADLTALYREHRSLIVAWGEIGLDYHWDTVDRTKQRDVFAAQIAAAWNLDSRLPLIIHCRDAQEDMLSVLRDAASPAPVVMHCFTGDTSAASACLDAGYFLGIGGVATFKKSEALRAAVAYAPLDRLLLETDCPYLAPQAWRGKRNEPSYLPAVAQTIAAARGSSVSDIADATTANAVGLFRMSGLDYSSR